MKTCEDCGKIIPELANHTGCERWCEDCFERGLMDDMDEHFDNFLKECEGEENE